MKTARNEALKPLQDTGKEAKRIAAAYKDLSAQLEATSALASKVDALSRKVTHIEQTVNFKPSALLTPAVRKGNQIVMSEGMAKLPYPGLREYTYYVLIALKRTTAATDDPTGLASGLADYFPSSFSGQSDFGKEIWKIFEQRTPGFEDQQGSR